jgi:pimeloyl-ACP methyl ester carboxylesterase
LKPAFFLHGGPGLTSLPERRWIGPKPGLEWWDQPRIAAGAAHGFRQLCEACGAAFLGYTAQASQPVQLVAASFGVHLALDLVDRFPNRISGLVLLSPTLDPQRAYLRLARQVLALHPGSVLRESIQAAQAQPGAREAFWSMVAQVLATPDFVDLYWGPGMPERRAQFKALLGDGSVFDFATFHAVLDDFLFSGEARPSSPLAFTGPVCAVIGNADGLYDPATDDAELLRCFPQARIQRLDAGHFLHLEAPAVSWMECT